MIGLADAERLPIPAVTLFAVPSAVTTDWRAVATAVWPCLYAVPVCPTARGSRSR
jgi:hypothetical protein